MKHIKLFENFSKEFDEKEWQRKILEDTNLINILYDLKDLSLEHLDIRHTNNNGILDKKIVFNIDLHDKEREFIGNLAGGEYSYENADIEENLYWSNDVTAEAEGVVNGLKSGKLYFNITFCIVVDDGNVSAINDDTGDVYKKISDMYPEVGFDTFEPWDLNY